MWQESQRDLEGSPPNMTFKYTSNSRTPSDRDWFTQRTKHPNKTEWFCAYEECADLYVAAPKQQLHKCKAQHRKATFSGQDSAVHLYLKEKGHSFEDSNVHILDREDRLFERGVEEPIYVKLEKTSLNRGGGLRYHLPSTDNAALSLLPSQFHNHSHLRSCDQNFK